MKMKKMIESIALALAVLLASTASQAALVRINIDATSVDGVTGTVALAYDDVNVVGGVLSAFHPGSKIVVFGQDYVIGDGFGTPTLTVAGDGTPLVFDFTLADMNPIDILEPGVESINFFGDLTFVAPGGSKGPEYAGALSVSAVPLPASAWLLVSGLLGLMGMRHRKS